MELQKRQAGDAKSPYAVSNDASLAVNGIMLPASDTFVLVQCVYKD